MNDWNLNDSFNNLFNFNDLLNNVVDNLFNFSNFDFRNNLLNNNFNDFNFGDVFFGEDWYFDSLWDIDELSHNGFNGDDLFDVNWYLLDNFLNDNLSLRDGLINNFFYKFLNDSFNFDDFVSDDLNGDNLFNDDLNFSNDFSDGLNWYCNLLDDLNFFFSGEDVVDWLFDFNDLSVDNNSFNNFLNLNDFGYFSVDWDKNLSFGGNLNDSLLNGGYFNEFFDHVVNNLEYFNGFVDNFLNFNVFGYFNDLLNVFLNGDDLGNLNDSFNDLLNNSFNFNDFRYNSEDFKDVINTDNSHNFLVDHSNDSLINFKDGSSSGSNLLEFFKNGLKEDSEMEFNSSGFG